MFLQQSFAILDLVELRDLGLVAVVLSVAFSTEKSTNFISYRRDILRLPLNDQRSAFRIDSICDRDEEENRFFDFDSSQEGVGEVNVDTVVAVQGEVVSWVWIRIELFSDFRGELLRQFLNSFLRGLQRSLDFFDQIDMRLCAATGNEERD